MQNDLSNDLTTQISQVGKSLIFKGPSLDSIDDTLRFSPNKLNTYDFCPQKAHYRYVENIIGPEEKPSEALLRGLIIHKYLEYWVRDNQPPSVSFERVQKDFPTYEGQLITYAVLTLMMRYCAVYKNDPQRYKVLAVEQELLVPFDTPKGRRVYLHGILDLVVEEIATGKLGLWDNKSDSRNKWSKEVVSFDRQLNQYAVMLMLMDYDPTYITVNTIYTGYTKPESIATAPIEKLFNRHTIQVTEQRLKQWAKAIGMRIDQILDAEYVHMRLGDHCIWCPYRTACNMVLDGQDPTPYLKSNFGSREQKALDIIIDLGDFE